MVAEQFITVYLLEIGFLIVFVIIPIMMNLNYANGRSLVAGRESRMACLFLINLYAVILSFGLVLRILY